MNSRILKLVAVLLIAVFATLSVRAQESTAEPTAEATAEATASVTQINVFEDFYNSPDGWHAQIPEGWTDVSTDEYAHFTYGSQSIYVFSYPDTNEEDAIAQAQLVVGVTPVGDPNGPTIYEAPVDVRSVNLINGTWVQRLYIRLDTRIVLHTQNFDGTQYVIGFVGDTSAVPFITTQEGAIEDLDLLQAAMSEATRTVLPETTLGIPTYTTGLTTPITALQVYPDSRVQAVGFARGTSVFTVTGALDGESMINSAGGYFGTLTMFFITPRTQPYLLLGVGLAAGIFIVLILSLYLRYRNFLKDEATLKALNEG
ncbi:MAG: hypothetical protein U0670_03945 [Anaerolineae bacterium]